MRNFRTYHVWKDSIDLVTKVYNLTKHLPAEEMYSLTKQIKRSAISIPSNFAEGCSRESEKELKHYVEVSLGSAFELETQLIIADNLFCIKELDLYTEVLDLLNKIQAKLNAFRNRLK